MTVNLTLSETSGGYALSDTTDLGTAAPGNSVGHQDVFISHDAEVSPITSCTIYVTRYSGSSYPGQDEDADLTELLGWGDSGNGGLELSMTPDSPWTSGDKFAAGWAYFKTGYGDVDNQIALDKNSIIIGTTPTNDGEIPVSGEAHVQIDIDIPSGATGNAGYRAFSLVFAYSATS